MHTIGLWTTLFSFWLLWSGHYTPLLISLGVASCIAVVLILRRLDIIDHEAVPLHLTGRIFFYLAWLTKEIGKANVDVIKLILAPKLNIEPNVIRTKVTQTSDLGKVIYANSITLTPGTVTIDIEDDEFIVHGINKAASDGVLSGEMDAYVTKVERDF